MMPRPAIAAICSSRVFVVIGARKVERLEEALGSQAVHLSAADLAAVGTALPQNAAAGGRYPETMLAHLDSEK